MPGRPRRFEVVAVSVAMVATACGQTATAARRPTVPAAGRAPISAASTTTTLAIPASALDAIAHRYRSSCKSPGAAVGVRVGNGPSRFAESGRLAPGIPITRDSQFLAGSVTKLLVATVALRLASEHVISLGDPVDRYLPGWPRGDRITIAMLLGHRSGMGDFGNDFSAQLRELVLSDLDRVFSYDDVLRLVRAVPPVAQPGARYHYSNANYIVLGAILRRVTHKTLGALLESRVIEPLGLTRTFYGPDDLTAAGAVVFHGLFDVSGTGHPIDIGSFPRAAALTVDPAGAGLFSTLPDLLSLTHTLFASSKLLQPAARSVLVGSVNTLSAHALLLGNSFRIAGHGGASPGAQTIVAYDAAHDATVAVWCNRLDPGEYELLPSVTAAKETFELVAKLH